MDLFLQLKTLFVCVFFDMVQIRFFCSLQNIYKKNFVNPKYTENKLTEEILRINKLISPIVLEQSIAGLPVSGMSGIFDPALPSKSINWVQTWNKHEWLNAVEIISGIAGSIPTPLSPILLGVSVASGLANGILYINEGDKYLGGFYIALSVLPGHQLWSVLKNSKKLKSVGVDKTKILIDKVHKGVATKAEEKVLQEIVSEAGPEAIRLARKTQKYIISQFISNLASKSLKYVLVFVITALKLGLGLTKVGIVLGGIFFTYDELFLFFNNKNDRALAMRSNSELAKMKDYLLENENLVKQEIIKNLISDNSVIVENAEKFLQIQPTETLKNEYLNLIRKKGDLIQTPSIEEVLLGKGVYGLNMKSPEIKKIQLLLKNLNYDSELSNYGNIENYIDGIYGNSTQQAVRFFQEDVTLPVTGNVDSKTLKKLVEKNREKNGKKVNS